MFVRMSSLIAALALIAAACGGAEESAPTSTSLRLPDTASATTQATVAVNVAPSTIAPVGATPRASGTFGATVLGSTEQVAFASGRFEATITMVPGPAAGIPGDVVITMSGAFNGETGDSEMRLDWGNIVELAMAEAGDEIPAEFADMFTEPMEIKTIGDKSYMRWGFFSMLLGTDKWIEGDADQSASATSGFGFGADGDSPTDVLESLADANADVEELGREEVRGVETTHYRAVLNIEDLARELTAAELEELQADIGELTITEFPIDVWVGDDGNVYRYSMVVDAAAAGGTDDFESMTMVFEMWDYDADIVIEPPPADEIATEDELGFNFSG